VRWLIQRAVEVPQLAYQLKLRIYLEAYENQLEAEIEYDDERNMITISLQLN
jgi:hypothetical protein